MYFILNMIYLFDLFDFLFFFYLNLYIIYILLIESNTFKVLFVNMKYIINSSLLYLFHSNVALNNYFQLFIIFCFINLVQLFIKLAI